MYNTTEPVASPSAGPDSQNPAARAFAIMRIKQFFQNGLGGGMNPSQIDSDPTEEWRQLSQGLGSDPARLQQFLHGPQAGAHPGYGGHVVPETDAATIQSQPEAGVAPEHVTQGIYAAAHTGSPRAQLDAIARAKSVARVMQMLRAMPVGQEIPGVRY